MNLVEKITKSQIRNDLPAFQVGDTVVVDLIITEKNSKGEERQRVQAFEGIVMAIKSSGVAKNFIVRKMSGGVGVERTFPMNLPTIKEIRVIRKGRVHQAKLGYIRKQVKDVKIKERN